LLVEVLTSYSHTTQLADLQRCTDVRRVAAVPPAELAATRAWSLRDRFDERARADMIAAYRAGATAASLAAEHAVSLRSVKRLLAAAGARRRHFSA
jgi:hypothetical protein